MTGSASASSVSPPSATNPGASSLADQIPFELGNRAKHVRLEGRRASWCRLPRSAIAGRRRSFPTGLRSRSDVGANARGDQVPGDESIAFSHEGEGLRQAGAICRSPRPAILENPVAAGVVKRIELESLRPAPPSKPAHNRSGPSETSGLVRFAVRQSFCPARRCQARVSGAEGIGR